MPKSLFARTAALLLALILALQMLLFIPSWLFIMRPLLAGSVNDLAALMSLSAKTWVELPAERRASYRQEMLLTHALEIEQVQDAVRGEPGRLPYLQMLEDALRAQTGAPVRVVVENDSAALYAVDLPAGRDTLRFRFGHERIGTNPVLAVAAVLGGSVLLGIMAALLVARGLTRPLARLAEATTRVGQRDEFTPLPEDGPRELAMLSREFNRMACNVRELLDNRTTLLAGISHDLRSPIARLRLALELCREQPDPKLYARMEQDLETMNALIGEFLEFSRGVGGEPPVPTDVAVLLAYLADEARQHGARVEVQKMAASMRRVPPLALRRVLSNFLDNAVRYGNDSTVEIALTGGDGDTVIEIMDRGPGIPEARREAVFRPFVRLESSRNAASGGSGLGLAIAKQIAHSQGWRVSLHERPGGGTIARLVLPTATSPAG